MRWLVMLMALCLGTPPGSAQNPVGSIRDIDFSNGYVLPGVNYDGRVYKKLILTNGRAQHKRTRFLFRDTLYGDLTGDDVEEAVLVVRVEYVKDKKRFRDIVFIMTLAPDGKAKMLSHKLFEKGTRQLSYVRVIKGELRTTSLERKKSGDKISPSLRCIRTWRWNGRDLVVVKKRCEKN